MTQEQTMATQPPVEPDHIQPQYPPETPTAPPEPSEPRPDEIWPIDPDIVTPGGNPLEYPGTALPL